MQVLHEYLELAQVRGLSTVPSARAATDPVITFCWLRHTMLERT